MTLADPLEDAWSDFSRSRTRRNRSKATLDIYRRSYVSFWEWVEHDDPGAVTHQQINAWVDHLRDTMKPSSVRIRWQNLRPFFSWWAKEMDTTSPFAKADTPDVSEPEIPVVPIEDLRALVKACAGKKFIDRRDNALIRVLIDTGARLGEVVNLKVDDWDRRSDLLKLDGKTGPRVVPISPSTGEALARYLRMRSQRSAAQLPDMWLGERRGRLTEPGVFQAVRRRCKEAGIDHINPHRLRHTFSHEFRAAGGGEGDLMYLAGWKTTAMAHRYGRSAAAQRAREAYRRMSLGDRL